MLVFLMDVGTYVDGIVKSGILKLGQFVMSHTLADFPVFKSL